jgi:hypothetical protein
MSSDVRSVNVGTVANDGTGDAIRSAFQTVNSNFANIDNRISTGNYGVVYSGTSIQANLTLTSLGSTTTETLRVNTTANVAGNVMVANLTVNNAFVASTVTSTGNTYVQDSLNVTNSAHITENLVVVGNLTVLGNTATVSSLDLVVQDSLINLHSPVDLSPLTTDDGKDIGLVFHYYKGSDKQAAMVWANDSQALEFYAEGTESAGNVFSGTYGNVKIGSLFVSNATAATSSTTGSIITQGGIAAAGGIWTAANLNVAGNTFLQTANVKQLSISERVVGSMYFTGSDTIYINGSAVSTSAGSFTGGSVAGAVTFGRDPASGLDTNQTIETKGNIFANSRVDSTSTNTGAITVKGGIGLTGNIVGGGIQNTPIGAYTASTGVFTTLRATGTLTAASTTDSSSVSSGALVVQGGVGIAGNLFVGGSINQTSIGVFGAGVGNFTTIGATTSGTGTFTFLRATANLFANSGTASTTVTNGALVVEGGVGVSGNINAGAVYSTFNGTAAITSGSVTGITGQASTFTATNLSSGNIVGILNGTATTSNVALYQQSTNTTTNASYYLQFTDRSTTGNSAGFVTSGISVNPSTNTVSASTFSGNVTAAQPLITSVGTLTGLTVSGAIVPNANATVNLGSTTAWFNNIYGVSSQAKYADLAEKYTSDSDYAPGTVLVFGGAQEVTVATEFADTRVAGAVTTDPAYLMNAELDGVAIALRGRIPVNVIGKVAKGDLLVTSTTPGCAVSVGNDRTYGPAVFAKALNNKDNDGIGQIEAVIL